jgi:hypothetical protein
MRPLCAVTVGLRDVLFGHTLTSCFCCSDGPGTLDFIQVRDFPPLLDVLPTRVVALVAA